MSVEPEGKVNVDTKKKRPWWKRAFQILAKTALLLLIIFFLVVLFVRSPWGQDIIVGKFTSYISGKTHTKVSIKKLFITFTGAIDLQELYLEDQKGDTLIYSHDLQVDIPLWPIIRGNPISIDGLEWTGLRANVIRRDSVEGFNFQFLIDAFASPETDTTSSELPEISIGSIHFSNFKVNFEDAVSGTFVNLNLGDFHFEGKYFDLNKMNFQVSEISLENTFVNYVQTRASSTSDSTSSETLLPYLSLDNLKLKDVFVHYKSVPDSLVAELNLASLELQIPKVDLVKQDILIGDFMLNNSSILVKMDAKEKTLTEPDPAVPESVVTFIWPNWNVTIESIAFQNNRLHYQVGEKSEIIKSFNPDYLVINGINFNAHNIAFSKNNSVNLQLDEFSFRENSGLVLSQLAFNATLNSNELSIDDLVFKAGNSSINTNLKAQFDSIQTLIEKPEETRLALDLKQFAIDLNDAFVIQPELRRNEYLKKLAQHKLTGKIEAKGTLSQMNLSQFLVKWGQNTSITTNGELLNLLDTDQFAANIDKLTFTSTRSDLSNFVSEEDLGISIPMYVYLQTQFKGKLDDFQAKMQVLIPEGKIKIDGHFKQRNEIAFDAKLSIEELNLGKILKNLSIGKVAFEMIASGKGKTINELDAELSSDFSKLEINGYDYSALQLHGNLNKGDGNVTLNYKDENLDLIVDSRVQLDSVSPKISVDFNLEGADLYALRLTERQIKAKLIMNANFKGNSDDFTFDSHVSEGLAVKDKSTYSLGIVDLSASVTRDSTAMDITSNFLNGNLRANADVDHITRAIEHHLEGYFSDSSKHTHSNPVMLKMNMKLTDSKILTDFLLPDIRTMDVLTFNLDFNQQENNLSAKLNLPYIDYADKTLDSLQLNFTSTENDAKFKFGFKELNAQPFFMQSTFLEGDLKNGILNLNFNAFDNVKESYVIRTEITGKTSNLTIHLKPEKLIFQGENWSIPADNSININNKKITAQNFVISRNDERLEIANNLIQTDQNNIGVRFNNFKLANLLALFNKDELLASGDLQGNIVAINPLEKLGLSADFNINNLSALKAPIGNLTLNANSKNGDIYDIKLNVKGEDVNLELEGDYDLQNPIAGLDFKLNLNKIGMKTIAIISGESLNEASGYISGELAVNGQVSTPKYEGFLMFNEAVFNVSQLNSKFRLANDKINISNDVITFKQFSIEDYQNNTFTLNGSILTENLMNPEFDLKVNGKNFQVLNSTKADNDLYYGTLNFDMEGTISGRMSFPKVDLNIGINERTNFTYVIPDAQAQLEKRDGIVEFVNKENPDNILTRASYSSNVELFGGIELHAKLTIDKEANFNIIIDSQTGDNLNVSGVGDLDFNIADNGRMTLSGRYDINDGHYSLSLYNLVKRRFELEPGSSIIWRGDPMDADLNVTAKYSIETSASALMASQTAGASEEIQNKYRQSLPFFVYLNVSGELDQPQLDFRLDMPEESRGAIDGTVYSYITQLNTEDDALNKQVFSLLVLRKFYPNSSSDGSSGGAESLVRNNLNDALSDQLNAFSDKLMGNTGIELDFGLNSYTDYQGESVEQRTDLNVSAQKKLLDDRLIVQVGSNVNVEGGPSSGEENPVVGNVSIHYLVTKDGRWRLKGFRNSEYENIIDGQVYVNGISFIFQRQFNHWDELLVEPAKENNSTKGLKGETERENTGEKSKSDIKAKD